MPQHRARFWPLVCTLSVAAFLWLPTLLLYGAALAHVVTAHPAELLRGLPLNPLQRFLFGNTIMLGVLTAACCTLMGLPAGIALARGPRRWRPLGGVLCALPLAIPPTVGASAWLVLTHSPPAYALASLAASKPSSLPPVPVAAFVLALAYFPLVVFPVWAALRAIPAEMEDAARLFGNAASTWRRVLGPLLSPAILGAAGLTCALAMWEIGGPDLLDARTYAVQIYRDLNAADNLDAQTKNALSALDGLSVLVLGAFALWPAARALRFYAGRTFASAHSHIEMPELTGSRREGAWAAALASLVFLISPLAILAVFVYQLRPPHVLLDVWDVSYSEIVNTAQLPTLATALVLTVSFVLVALWRDWPARARHRALALCVSPLLIAPILLAIALINFWNRPCFTLFYGGLADNGNPLRDWLVDAMARGAMTTIGYIARFLPLAILLVYEAALRVDDSLTEAGRNLGATSAHVARTILAPLLRPALLGVGALVWALCAGELSTSVLVNSPGGQTLPVPVFNRMHIGSTSEVAALSLTLAAMSGTAMLLATLALRVWKRP